MIIQKIKNIKKYVKTLLISNESRIVKWEFKYGKLKNFEKIKKNSKKQLTNNPFYDNIYLVDTKMYHGQQRY